MAMLQTDKGPGRRLWLYGLLISLLLTPFLFGGVMSGDGNEMLELSYRFDNSGLSFHDFVSGPHGGYAFHHVLWFGLTYVTLKVIGIFGAARFLNQVGVSAEQILVALAGVVLCHVYLVRRQKIAPPISAAVLLATFVGSYGIFVITMGGTVESWMIPVMAARLFCFEGPATRPKALGLAVADLLLFAFKAYSAVFIVILFPLFWRRAPRDARLTYIAVLGVLVLAFVLFKLWIWNPMPEYFEPQNLPDFVWRLAQQIVSPWTGLPICMPVLLVLFWTAPAQRTALYFKLASLLGVMLFFSCYWFFDGGIPGGRYVFPYVLVLLPEIGEAAARLLNRHPRAIWLLPAIVAFFLPTAALSLPYFPKSKIVSTGPCTQLNPGLYAWRLMAKKAAGDHDVAICYLNDGYTMDIRDATSPRTAPLRVAYILSGGHSLSYLATIHDNGEQQQHDGWASMLSARLSKLGLGSPLLWVFLGLLPAFAAICLAIVLAWRISRQSLELPAGTQ